MQTISIATIANINGDRIYRAAIGDRQFTGRTAGEALDALTMQIGSRPLAKVQEICKIDIKSIDRK